jgi:methylthioribose-1-phosphate isomerase
MIKPIEWLGERLRLLDQTELPLKELYIDITDYRDAVSAIKQLKVRGAPAIGIAAAYGIALGALSIRSQNRAAFEKQFTLILDEFARSRPTAVNLFYAIDLMKRTAFKCKNTLEIQKQLIKTAKSIHASEEKAMKRLSQYGAELLHDGFTVLTHCNTGTLATGVKYGTALGVVQAATEQGKKIRLYADETRPLLQGARLTMWEAMQLGIQATLITDNMAGYFLNRHEIDLVIVGADRIASNGDTANKIGTYSVAVLAAANRVPFYVAAPVSSIDLSIKSGVDIPIEQRNPDEVLSIKGVRIAPRKARALSPAFDVTPNKYIAGIITEKGIIGRPFKRNISIMLQEVS